MTTGKARSDFWSAHQPGFRFTDAEVGSSRFFADIEAHRYALEPHIPAIVGFERWAGRDVLEAGCGIATDGARFARAGARYTGLDASATAIDLARRRFALDGLEGRFLHGSLTELPFEDESFDLVFSHGAIHHVPDTQSGVDEFHRVLRPGGRAIVMVYHRSSLNYFVNIMLIRRALVPLLVLPGAGERLARLTGEDPDVLRGHRELLRRHGTRYLTDRELFLSNNTDGPGNPLSKVFTRAQLAALFSAFSSARTMVRFLNLRVYPGGSRLASARLAKRLEQRVGWHLYIEAVR